MLKKRDELEQELFEQVQPAIRKLLDELPDTSVMTLSDMESATGKMGEIITEQTLIVLTPLVESRFGAPHPSESAVLPPSPSWLRESERSEQG